MKTGNHAASGPEAARSELGYSAIRAETRKRRGRPSDPNSLKFRTVGLPAAWWEWLEQWPGENPTAKLNAVFEYVTTMRPLGPDVRPRDARGRYCRPEADRG